MSGILFFIFASCHPLNKYTQQLYRYVIIVTVLALSNLSSFFSLKSGLVALLYVSVDMGLYSLYTMILQILLITKGKV